MKELLVNCITTPPRMHKHGQITHIGNTGKRNGTEARAGYSFAWRITAEEAIAQIESGTTAFFTVPQRTGIRAYLGVFKEEGKPPRLRARVSGIWNDHLLTQTQCETELP